MGVMNTDEDLILPKIRAIFSLCPIVMSSRVNFVLGTAVTQDDGRLTATH